MAASYKKLFKILIDREMKSKDGAVVSSEVLVKICTALNCTMDDIVEIVFDERA